MKISEQARKWSGSSADIDHAAVAEAFVAAWRDRSFVSAPSRAIPGFTRADATDIAERVRALRIAGGAVPIGYKVGFTNAAVRSQFDATGPMAATVYDQTLTAAPRISAASLLGPRIEPEVVVGLGADGEITWAALGFEIVQSHIADWDFRYLDTIVDFGLHAALVVGERRPITADDAAWLTAMPVQLRCNGDVVERGAGSGVDGGALGSIEWLRAELRHAGRELQPGEIVSTGSMTRVPKIAAGERWTIEASGDPLPPLTIHVE